MRLIAPVTNSASPVVRLMLHDAGSAGVYLFGFDSPDDCAAAWDYWFETVPAAQAVAQHSYGVAPDCWQRIGDLPEGCQQDWIAPVRVKGRASGAPQWGRLETLVNNEWVDFHPEQF